MLYDFVGDAENEPREADISRLVEDLFKDNLLLDLLMNIKRFEFEVKDKKSDKTEAPLNNNEHTTEIDSTVWYIN